MRFRIVCTTDTITTHVCVSACMASRQAKQYENAQHETQFVKSNYIQNKEMHQILYWMLVMHFVYPENIHCP